MFLLLSPLTLPLPLLPPSPPPPLLPFLPLPLSLLRRIISWYRFPQHACFLPLSLFLSLFLKILTAQVLLSAFRCTTTTVSCGFMLNCLLSSIRIQNIQIYTPYKHTNSHIQSNIYHMCLILMMMMTMVVMEMVCTAE